MVDVDHSGLRLANDLFFVMHDDITGRMRLAPRLTGLALAAALVGELMLTGRVTVGLAARQIRLVPVDTAPTGDAVTQSALDHIVAEPSHRFRTWLQFLARTAYADVAARMTAEGLLRPASGRLTRRQAPVDPNTAAWPVGRLNLAIQRSQPLDAQDGVLLGLLTVTGGGRLVLWDQNPAYLSRSRSALPLPLQELVTQTEAAIGDSVISRR
ncbi:GPP34 family phosphoprotein [Sphaerisporangium sp. NPDC049002]|uniref:GOLPH3/VPS74 family protein n=1 Tax=unclassified Sphaerisporangium TaxID=2630420 RepID=UPI0033DCDCE3